LLAAIRKEAAEESRRSRTGVSGLRNAQPSRHPEWYPKTVGWTTGQGKPKADRAGTDQRKLDGEEAEG
jgi:hypothetical protein